MHYFKKFVLILFVKFVLYFSYKQDRWSRRGSILQKMF